MANDRGGADPDELPTQPVPNAGAGATPPAGVGPVPGNEPRGETAPTMPIVPVRPSGSRRVGQLSPQERGIAPPRGLSATTRNVRVTLVALSALLLVACCAASWGFASAIFQPPGGPVAAAATASSGSPTSSAAAATETASATDQPTATLGNGATPTDGGDATPTDTPTSPPASPTDTPLPTPPPTATPRPNPYCNPWGYNFTLGQPIYNPNAAFCSVFPCVGNFWGQFGYVVECNDELFAHNGGAGAKTCRGNGGWYRNLYQH